VSDRRPPQGEGFDLQRVYAEKTKPFWFRWEDQWWTLPHMKMLDFEVQARVAEFDFATLADLGSDPEGIAAARTKVDEFFALLMGDEQGADWAKVSRPLHPLLDMIREWTEHSGGDMGESSASEGSSPSTGRPSKRTSKSSTRSGSRRRSTETVVIPGEVVTPPVNS
jgi:hypothetical protein